MLSIIKPKACKKCGGDLSLECDIYGVYIQCIQCGANWNEKDINLKPKDVETIIKAVKVKRPTTAVPAQKTSQVTGTKRLVVPFPKKPEYQAEKTDKQGSFVATGRRSSRSPAP
jgi:hypothetical protein